MKPGGGVGRDGVITECAKDRGKSTSFYPVKASEKFHEHGQKLSLLLEKRIITQKKRQSSRQKVNWETGRARVKQRLLSRLDSGTGRSFPERFSFLRPVLLEEFQVCLLCDFVATVLLHKLQGCLARLVLDVWIRPSLQ